MSVQATTGVHPLPGEGLLCVLPQGRTSFYLKVLLQAPGLDRGEIASFLEEALD